MIDLSNILLVFDIDGVIRDVSGSYRRALSDTVEHFTGGNYRPSPEDIDGLKAEGIWNNDWEAAQELIERYFDALIGSVPPPGKISKEKASYAEIVKFFQSRYRGTDPQDWNGYITQEPLIATPAYFQQLQVAEIRWGFFSGATRGSATYVLNRLGLKSSVLIAMEDAPGKPDPTGLFEVVRQLCNVSDRHHSTHGTIRVIYVGDTSADMMTLQKARTIDPEGLYVGVGAIPPHVEPEQREAYTAMLRSQGADLVIDSILTLTPELIGTPEFLHFFDRANAE